VKIELDGEVIVPWVQGRDARLISWQAAPTRVTNAAKNPDICPAGHGQLVSFRVMITNAGTKPFQFGPLVIRSPAPSYHADSTAELLLSSEVGAPEEIGYPAILNGVVVEAGLHRLRGTIRFPCQRGDHHEDHR
jgi:hypothetical protein